MCIQYIYSIYTKLRSTWKNDNVRCYKICEYKYLIDSLSQRANKNYYNIIIYAF